MGLRFSGAFSKDSQRFNKYEEFKLNILLEAMKKEKIKLIDGLRYLFIMFKFR